MRATWDAKKARPARLTYPSAASREASARSDSPDARSSRDRRLLSLLDHEAPSICAQGKAVGHRADALAMSALGRECRARPSANEAVLVLRSAIEHHAQKGVCRRVTVALARCAHKAGACARDVTLELHGEHHVACDAVPPGNDKEAGPMRAERPQRRTQSWTFRKGSDAADAAIHMPGCHADALAGRPRLDARTLSLGREPLFLRGCTQVRDGNVGTAEDGELAHGSEP
jgi:hypothetical protein